jgi:hypothetical protein
LLAVRPGSTTLADAAAPEQQNNLPAGANRRRDTPVVIHSTDTRRGLVGERTLPKPEN